MPVYEDSSIVPDSTYGSPPPGTPLLVKRAVRTYGRPRHVEPAGDDSDTSLLHSAKSSGSHDSVYRTGPPDLNEEIPPSSDPAQPYPDTDHADDEDENASHDASPNYQFDWKRKLKEIDEQEDFDVEMVGISQEGNASRSRVEPAEDPDLSFQRPDSKGRAHVPMSPAESGIDALTEDVFGGSLNTLTAASPPRHSSIGKSPSPQPAPIHRRNKRVIQDSDSEEGENKDSSPASPAFPHAITTPNLHSSPTPPTSDDEMVAHSRRETKGKGKAKFPNRPNVLPLQFSEGLNSTSALKSQKASFNDTLRKKQKVKAPTKKELTETARNRLRIAADQQIAIPRADDATAKYSIQSLFTTISMESKQREPEQDPIADFSDPVSSPAYMYVAPSPPTLRQDAVSPLRPSPMHARKSPLKAMASLPELNDDSDTELPEVGALVAQEKGKQEHAKRQQELLETKLRLVAAQSTETQSDDDDGFVVQAPDRRMAMKTEDADRKSGRKQRTSEGRKRQLNLGGIPLSKQKAKEGPKSARSQKGKKDDRPSTQAELNKILAKKAEDKRQEIIREKEDEWMRRGGKVRSENQVASSSIQAASKVYAEKGLKLPQGRPTGMDVDLDEDDKSDAEWAPEERTEERGSASPSPRPADSGDEDDETQIFEGDADITMVNEEDPTARTEDEDMEERLPIKLPARRSTNKQILDSDSEAEDENNDENSVPKPTRLALTRSRVLTSPLEAQDSNEESASLPPVHGPSTLSHRGSLSSMDDPTEDEGDKENETSRMWDRGEDKENKAVVRHAVAGAKPPLGTRKSSLFDLDFGRSRESSMSPGLDTRYTDVDNEDGGKGDEENRRPFKDLLDDDPFLSPSRSSKFPTSFETRLKQASPNAPFPSTTSLMLAPFIVTKNLGSSQFPDDEGTGPALLQPGFSDLFESGTEKQKGAALKRPLAGLSLSVSFSEDTSPVNKLRGTSFAGDLGLTQDVTLHPAFQVSGNLLRKADEIFEKEQEYVLEAANKKPQTEPELYVNDHGFLTQTRPDVPNPEIYKPPSPSQDTASNQPSEHQSSSRRPLRTISLSDSVDFLSPAPLNRLHRRAATPTPPLLEPGYRSTPSPSPGPLKRPVNVFDVMGRAAKAHTDRSKRKLEKSEFIEQEAQESDDDEMFGFGPRIKDNQDEEDGEDLNKTLETLVDDKEMDEETVAAQLVMEKYKEQSEADDREVEKLHQAAVQGELRKKRRNRGIGMEDSDEDSDEDESNRRIRRGMHKKQKIDRDNIKQLGEHEETKSFYDVYENDLMADDTDFKYLQDSQPQDVVMANHEEDEEEEPREVITTAEIRRRAREVAQQPRDEDEEQRDLRDVSWIDEGQSDEENLPVKSVDFTVKKPPAMRRRRMEQADFDVGFEMPPPRAGIAEGSISRMQSWAKIEGRSRHNGTTGRNVGGAAVTGHKAKSGGGSLRSNPAASSASNVSSRPSEQRRPAQPSLLENVAAETRSTRFG